MRGINLFKHLRFFKSSPAAFSFGDGDGVLAEKLGVSTRSVRTYVTSVKSAASPFDIIATSSAGYRLNRDSYFAYRESVEGSGTSAPSTPRERVHYICQRLAEVPSGISLDTLASELHVSSATIENDVRRLRSIALECDVQLDRIDNVLIFRADESHVRRLLSSLVHETADEAEAQRLLQLGDVQFVINIPADFTRQLNQARSEERRDGSRSGRPRD